MTAPAKKKKRRIWPTKRSLRAAEIGADELESLLEWELRNKPKELRKARNFYRLVCDEILEHLERLRP